MAKRVDIQPARISYVFDKGYQDLGNTIKEAWARNLQDGRTQFEIAKANGIASMGGAVHAIAALCIFVFGSMITAITTALHVFVLAILLFFIYILFGIVWLIDRIYIAVNKIRSACPNSSCQESFLIPAYACSCGRVHTRLVPGKYGIYKRTCLCGTKLPTTFLNGRNSLVAYCPHCGTALSGDTASRQYAIPVIGGPSVGKTCLLNMAVENLVEKVAPANNWDLNFMFDPDRKQYETTISSFKRGIRPLKTDADALTAYQLMLRLPNEKIGRRLYVYDISGEMFSSSSDVQRNNAYSYADGFVFVIDPLTIPRFAAEVEDVVDINSYGVSEKDFDDILNIMLINLEKMFGLKPKDVLKRNLAVVINKCDIPGITEEIGDGATQAYMNQNADCKDFMQAKNAICKAFLEKYESGNFVRTAESKFRQVQYFTCSALGHNKEGVPFEGINVEAPFLWILSSVDSAVKASG